MEDDDFESPLKREQPKGGKLSKFGLSEPLIKINYFVK